MTYTRIKMLVKNKKEFEVLLDGVIYKGLNEGDTYNVYKGKGLLISYDGKRIHEFQPPKTMFEQNVSDAFSSVLMSEGE